MDRLPSREFGVTTESPVCEQPNSSAGGAATLEGGSHGSPSSGRPDCPLAADEVSGRVGVSSLPRRPMGHAQGRRLDHSRSGNILRLVQALRQHVAVCPGGDQATRSLTLGSRHLAAAGGFIHFPRPKTGIPRRYPLWPKAVAALQFAGRSPDPEGRRARQPGVRRRLLGRIHLRALPGEYPATPSVAGSPAAPARDPASVRRLSPPPSTTRLAPNEKAGDGFIPGLSMIVTGDKRILKTRRARSGSRGSSVAAASTRNASRVP